MKVFVCKVCGEVYIGDKKPHTCPFCGVDNKYLVLSKEWDEDYNIKLNAIEKKYLKESLKLELTNTAFYHCAYETLANKEIGLMFKGLSKVENEHASVFRKLLRPTKDPVVKIKCKDDAFWCVDESLKKEIHAVKFYAEALSKVTHPKLKQVFEAIMEAEQDHITLDKETEKKIQGVK